MVEEQTTQGRWDARYQASEAPGPVVKVVAENLHLLPATGTALDVASGLAGNAFALAEQGLTTYAWDISPVATDKVRTAAASRGLAVTAEVRDVTAEPLAAASFDVIVVSHFLERRLNQGLVEALRPGGVLYYQTFTRTCVNDVGPSKAEWRLMDGELLTMFPMLKPLVYREEGRVGDVTQGFRDEALLVAQKPEG